MYISYNVSLSLPHISLSVAELDLILGFIANKEGMMGSVIWMSLYLRLSKYMMLLYHQLPRLTTATVRMYWKSHTRNCFVPNAILTNVIWSSYLRIYFCKHSFSTTNAVVKRTSGNFAQYPILLFYLELCADFLQ